jgi:hypothetical protein
MKKVTKIFIVEDDAFYASLLKNEVLKNRLGFTTTWAVVH